MIHSWELVLNELFWPMVGAYFGMKVHWSLALIFGIMGFLFAEYLILTALQNNWVVK